VLNIQPVIPISVNDDWNILTRTILPVISQPEFAPGQGRTNGIGDVQFSAFLSRADPGELVWGVGTIAQLPTHNDRALGNNNAELGPTFVVLHLSQGDPWVFGVLANNVWSLGTSSGAPAYNNGLIQPFVNYNFQHGLFCLVTRSLAATSLFNAPSAQANTTRARNASACAVLRRSAQAFNCSVSASVSTSSALRLPAISPSSLGSNCTRGNAMILSSTN
jgi:hypothetical protein